MLPGVALNVALNLNFSGFSTTLDSLTRLSLSYSITGHLVHVIPFKYSLVHDLISSFSLFIAFIRSEKIVSTDIVSSDD